MEIKAASANYNYRYQQNFNGLTKTLSRRMYIDGKKEIFEIIKRRGNLSTTVGKLPPVIFQAIPKENLEADIKKVIRIFGEVANEIRAFKRTSDRTPQEQANLRPQSAVDKLRALFLELKLINNKTNFDLKFLGEGNYKRAFKIEGVKDPNTEEELCYKVFHIVDKTPEWHKYKTHGNYAELNTAMYWMKTFGYNTQRGKFYFGNINDGFFVDKFIGENVSEPKKIVSHELVGVKLTDEFSGRVGHNKIQGYSIDPGGPRVVNRVKNSSKIARKIFKYIGSLPLEEREKEWHRIFFEETNLEFEQKLAGLAISLKHLKTRSIYYNICMRLNHRLANIGLAYVIKYQKPENARKYFRLMMQHHKNDPVVQTVLLNEIPLIARNSRSEDDLDVPKGEIKTSIIDKYYTIARKYVSPEVEEHLASYIHLLPPQKIIPEAKRLIAKNKYEINDRLLHKIKFVKDEEFSFSKKMEIINLLEKVDLPEFLKKKTQEVRLFLIRSQLADD